MKFSSYLSLFAIIFSSVTAHITIKNPLPRAHPLNPNAKVKDTACITAPLNGGPGCAPKPFPCGGYPIDAKITQVLKAGDVINVSFWNPNFPNGPKPADATADQARHNGGTCEFALSYDGGLSYTVIATYHKTCPDIFFNWKVKIPEDAPSCDTRGKCIFSWSWINAVGNREFYQNCADVKIKGNATKPLPIKDITRANLPPLFTNIITPDGDPANTGDAKGSGPQRSDVSINLGSSLSGSSDKVSTTIPEKTAPTQGSGKPNATNPGKTTRKPNTAKPGKPTTEKKNAAKTNAPTKPAAGSPTLNDASSCSDDAGTSSFNHTDKRFLHH